ncbi:hypothetical protein [Actinokineospora iranica]|uniref:Uncharacterized protein n=1 Tax=Actinokineospora iranica TaxID=1271860 RepID=A0A1G6P7E9_9PSEU|nr:hypothetical protein [Actinokineospora iranica]SDC76190.1 hypothetical protein SAMN05216174_104159 [Actinokineospora iranica]
MTRPDITISTEVEIDYGQVYIYSASPWGRKPPSEAVTRALNDAEQSERFVGVADGLIDLVVPFRKSFNAPMRIEVWQQEPPPDDDTWDHVVDVDFDVVDGRIVFEPSGGFGSLSTEESVPSGAYRARVSGRGYTEAASGAEGSDSYQLRLWPRDADTPPALRKSWSGFPTSG